MKMVLTVAESTDKRGCEVSRGPKHSHSDRDRIFTPLELVRKLINKIPYSNDDTWLDPCYGNGAFYDNFPTKNKDLCEIDMDKDFLTHDHRYDWIVTNIPFSQPKEFIFKMAELCDKGFGILCLANSMTATRLKKLEDMGLYLHSMTVLYVKQWGFGYRTDFYVFTKSKGAFETIIVR